MLSCFYGIAFRLLLLFYHPHPSMSLRAYLARLPGTEYCIDELCIRTECQGQGLGARFVREIEAACRGMGLKYLFLLTEDDVPAYAFYKKLGFTESEHNVAFSKRL